MNKEQKNFLEGLAAIKSKEDLDALVGEITDEEKQMLGAIDLNTPATKEELEALGPDFIERLNTRAEIRSEIKKWIISYGKEATEEEITRWELIFRKTIKQKADGNLENN